MFANTPAMIFGSSYQQVPEDPEREAASPGRAKASTLRRLGVALLLVAGVCATALAVVKFGGPHRGGGVPAAAVVGGANPKPSGAGARGLLEAGEGPSRSVGAGEGEASRQEGGDGGEAAHWISTRPPAKRVWSRYAGGVWCLYDSDCNTHDSWCMPYCDTRCVGFELFQWCIGRYEGECRCHERNTPIQVPGRPYVVDSEPVSTPLAGPMPQVSAAAAWAEQGLAEYTSVASFARFSLDLLAAGAPVELVEGAHRAALEEVRHAETSFGFAARLAAPGAEVPRPGKLPAHSLRVSGDVRELARRVLVEGVAGETVAARVAEVQAENAEGEFKAGLQVIAAEEASHADLAFRTLQWAMAEDPMVASDVAAHLAGLAEKAERAKELVSIRPDAAVAKGVGEMAKYGRLDAAFEAWVRARAEVDLVAPRLLALLAPLDGDNFAAPASNSTIGPDGDYFDVVIRPAAAVVSF